MYILYTEPPEGTESMQDSGFPEALVSVYQPGFRVRDCPGPPVLLVKAVPLVWCKTLELQHEGRLWDSRNRSSPAPLATCILCLQPCSLQWNHPGFDSALCVCSGAQFLVQLGSQEPPSIWADAGALSKMAEPWSGFPSTTAFPDTHPSTSPAPGSALSVLQAKWEPVLFLISNGQGVVGNGLSMSFYVWFYPQLDWQLLLCDWAAQPGGLGLFWKKWAQGPSGEEEDEEGAGWDVALAWSGG